MLGPLLFTLYTSDVLKAITNHGFTAHAYADDLQIYGHTDKAGMPELKRRLSACVSEVQSWMASHRLKLNPSKTELIWLGSKRIYDDYYTDTLEICGTQISFSNSVRVLGVILDNPLSMEGHTNSIIKSCYFTLRQLWQIRRSVTVETAKNLACSFIHSRLDYCNTALISSSQQQIKRLNAILRAAARFVFLLPKFHPVTNLMISNLHWLPFPQRIDYKVCTLAYKSVNSHAPVYLKECFSPVLDTRLRSATTNKVLVPSISTRWYGERGFSHAGPLRWNSLPSSLRCPTLSFHVFSKMLKTHFFQSCNGQH